MKYLLSEDWRLKASSKSELPGSIKFPEAGIRTAVPGTVHTDLLKAEIISEPYYADNELKLNWVQEIDWIYENTFNLPQGFDFKKSIYLECTGLDTITKICLNGNVLGITENMFRKYVFFINSHLLKNNNTLQIRFFSPLKQARMLEKKYGKLDVALNSERVYLRKAQYSFGWDWGPSFPTMGIWRPIYLLQRELAWIGDVRFHTKMLQKNSATVLISIDLHGETSNKLRLVIYLWDDHQNIRKELSSVQKKTIRQTVKINKPVLWWPNGEGEPHLYHLKIELYGERGKLFDRRITTVGIRTIRLLTEDKGENSFRFIVNDRPIFVKGVNWIPADSFLPSIVPEKYQTLLNLAKTANVNMIRVWGGGIYEEGNFYEFCDKLGLMVWQDFMFACGSYPEHPNFLENIKEEFQQNINRLQHHPCLALWCGNNENEWGWYLQQGGSVNKMPGYRIYHNIIPDILKKFDPLQPYWPSSPFGTDSDPNSTNSGNTHQWEIWSTWVDYTEVKSDESLFVTEFGFQGPANRTTLEKVIPNSEHHSQSEIFEFHNKQIEGTERIFRFLSGHLPIRFKWDDFIYLSQLNQGFALKTCVEHWRSRWPDTAGSIIWQLNDCWPATSWSLIDYKLEPKIAYYFVKRAFAPVFVYFKDNDKDITIVGMNQGPKAFHGKLKINIWEISTWNDQKMDCFKCKIGSSKFGAIYSIPVSKLPYQGNWIIAATLVDENDAIIHRNIYLKKKWKHLKLSQANIKLEKVNVRGNGYIKLTTDKPAFFVDLFHPNINFNDRGLIVLPEENIKVGLSTQNVKLVNIEDIDIFMLNNYLRS